MIVIIIIISTVGVADQEHLHFLDEYTVVVQPSVLEAVWGHGLI